MNVVVDANLVAAVVMPLPYTALARQLVLDWAETKVDVLAPALLEYEVLSIIRQSLFLKRASTMYAQKVVQRFLNLDIEIRPATPELHIRALVWAERLGQKRAYDAHYLALAEQLGTELWTADKRLANGAAQAGIDWVKSIIA